MDLNKLDRLTAKESIRLVHPHWSRLNTPHLKPHQPYWDSKRKKMSVWADPSYCCYECGEELQHNDYEDVWFCPNEVSCENGYFHSIRNDLQ